VKNEVSYLQMNIISKLPIKSYSLGMRDEVAYK